MASLTCLGFGLSCQLSSLNLLHMVILPPSGQPRIQKYKSRAVSLLQAQAGAHCFPVLLVSEVGGRKQETMSQALLSPTPVYCLVRAVSGQALTCPFRIPWRDQGLRRSRPRFWGAQTVQLLIVYARCFILHKAIHAKPPPWIQKDRHSRLKVVQ